MDDVAPGWDDLRVRLAPLIGERVFAYFGLAVTSETNDLDSSASFRAELESTGNDPDRPQVTETESLIIEWGRQAARGALDPQLAQRAETAFSTQLATLLGEGVALAIGR